jgi:hypothetical protein
MKQGCIAWRGGERCAHYPLSVDIAIILTIHLGEVDCCTSKLRIEPQCSLGFYLCFCGAAPAGKEIPERYARFRTVGIEVLGRHEFSRRMLEAFAICKRLTPG